MLSRQLARERWAHSLCSGREGVRVQLLDASLRWRVTSTDLLGSFPGLKACGEHGEQDWAEEDVQVQCHRHGLSWSHWLLWGWMNRQSLSSWDEGTGPLSLTFDHSLGSDCRRKRDMTLGHISLAHSPERISAESCWLPILQPLRDEVRVGAKLGHAPRFTAKNTSPKSDCHR